MTSPTPQDFEKAKEICEKEWENWTDCLRFTDKLQKSIAQALADEREKHGAKVYFYEGSDMEAKELNRLESEKSELEKQIGVLKRGGQLMNGQCEFYKSEYTKLESEKSLLESDIRKLTAERDVEIKRARVAENEKSLLEKRVRELDEAWRLYQKLLAEEEAKSDGFEAQVIRLKNSVPDSVKSYIAQVESQQDTIKALEAENERLKAKFERLSNHLFGAPHNCNCDMSEEGKV